MKKTSINHLYIFLPLCLFSFMVIGGPKVVTPYKEVEKKSIIDSVRAKNTLTLYEIEKKIKDYELINRSN